ncbi:MAG: type II toxin-antitoxin system HicB family antitoxin [Candidatus Sumerlaeaceae bacterium]
MRRQFTASLTREGKWIVAQCREIEIATQGETETEALKMLQEAIELHFMPPVATVLPQVRTREVDIPAA